VSSRCASWLSHCLLSSSHCAALSSSCPTSWLSHHLSPSSHCAALSSSCRASRLSRCLSPSSCYAILLSTRCASLLSHCLSSSSRCAPHHPLVLSLHRLVVVALPLDALPSHRLVVLLCHLRCLVTPASCHTIISRCPLIAPPSHPLIVLAGYCVACHCAALSSSRRSPSPMPSNAAKHCCHHQTPPQLPSLNAVSIVHR
jgi:hypothetical protein